MSVRIIRFAGAIAYARVAARAEHAVALLYHRVRVGKVMKNLGHEHKISAGIRERDRLARPASVDHVAARRLAASLIDHLLRRVDANHPRAEMRRQQLGKASCPAAEVDHQRYRRSVDTSREQALPEATRFRREGARFVVAGSDLGLVVIHGDDESRMAPR